MDQQPYTEMYIVGESIISAKESRELITNTVGITVYKNTLILKDIDDIEIHKHKKVPVYDHCVTIYSSTYDRVKKICKNGNIDLGIQGAEYIKFESSNKSMYSSAVSLGKYKDSCPIYEGEFMSSLFNIISASSTPMPHT